MQALRQAIVRAGAGLAGIGRQAGLGGESLSAAAAAAMEARPLSSLVSLRAFHWQQTPAAQPEVDAAKAALKEPLPPWTPTRELAKRKTLTKRMGHLLQVLERQREEEARREKPLPEFRPGDVLELKLSIPENKRRATVFKGICIAKRNRGYRSSFTMRNFIGASGGIERTFPLYSPHILELRVLESRKVRRAKLYYLRDRVPKESRVT